MVQPQSVSVTAKAYVDGCAPVMIRLRDQVQYYVKKDLGYCLRWALYPNV